MFAGISIGAIIPILPVLATSMSFTGLTYSAVVASFALTRLVGSVQVGVFVCVVWECVRGGGGGGGGPQRYML